jgi:hypothetical protein
MAYLGLHNKPKAEVQPGYLLTGTKEEEEEEKIRRGYFLLPGHSSDATDALQPDCLLRNPTSNMIRLPLFFHLTL